MWMNVRCIAPSKTYSASDPSPSCVTSGWSTCMRRLLVRGGPKLWIKDIIKEYGFMDYSRFTSEYQELFDEKPSHTQRRRDKPLNWISWSRP